MNELTANLLSNKWQLSGTYFELCTCTLHQVCIRCSQIGERCQFALSWHVEQGFVRHVDVGGMSLVLAGCRDQNSQYIVLYVDGRASSTQQRALADIFLACRAEIGEVAAIRPTAIYLQHHPQRKQMMIVEDYVYGVASQAVTHKQADRFRVADYPLQWDVQGRRGFAAPFPNDFSMEKDDEQAKNETKDKRG